MVHSIASRLDSCLRSPLPRQRLTSRAARPLSGHPLDLLIPAGWELHGQVDWPQHKGSPSLAFRVNSPDGRIGLEYLPQESSSWSENPGTRTSLQAHGVEPLPPTSAADYLQRVLLPKLRPDARVISIERLPEIAGYLNEELEDVNRLAQYGAERNGLAAPKSSGDAARARISSLRDGALAEEWLEIAVEHLQRREDRNPWKPGETARVSVEPEGDAEFIVTDSADFDPNRKIGTQSWQRLQPEAAH